MFCKNCGSALEDNVQVCPNCSTQIAPEQSVAPAPQQSAVPTPQQSPAPAPQQTVVYANPQPVIPEEYQPMSAWGYVGLQILFAVPVVGLIFLLIFTFKKSNLNRRNFARSYWCWLVIWAVIAALIAGIAAATGYTVNELF